MVDVIAEYEAALKAKTAIEDELEACAAELTSGTNPGLSGSVVDADGFPRADIDVYRVRQLRHAVAVKQTDHHLIMQKIEALLPQWVKCNEPRVFYLGFCLPRVFHPGFFRNCMPTTRCAYLNQGVSSSPWYIRDHDDL